MHVAERTHRKLIKHEEVGDKRAPTARSKTKELILYSFIHEYKEKYKKNNNYYYHTCFQIFRIAHYNAMLLRLLIFRK